MNNNNDEKQIDEGAKELISIAFIASLLSIPGIVDAKSIEQNIPNKATNEQIQSGLKKAASEEKLYGGYTSLQLANIIARTLYGEAGGESDEGKRMVATVIMNRAGNNLDNVASVCFAKKQFSMWNKFSNSKKTPGTFVVTVPKKVIMNKIDKASWDDCQKIASEILAENFSILGNWNSYLNPDTADKSAVDGWGTSMSNQKTVGKHKFGYLANNDGYRKAKKKSSSAKVPQYPSTYKVQKTDKGVSFIAKNLIKSGKTPIKDLKKLTDKIISLNNLGPKAIIHPNDVLKLPLSESLR